MQPHDIRNQIPLTDQTNPSKFPQYAYKPYPRMMLDDDGKPYLNGAKQPVIVNNEAEEAKFKATPHAQDKKVGAVSALAKDESAEMKALKDELAALKAKPAKGKSKVAA